MHTRVLSKTDHEAGATILEFALAAIVIFGLIGAVFDIGLALHHRSYLQHTVSKASREIGIRLTMARSCTGVVEDYLRNNATPELASAFSSGSKAKWRYALEPGSPFPLLQIEGSVPIDCFFLCNLFPEGSQVSATASASVESGSLTDQNSCTGRLN